MLKHPKIKKKGTKKKEKKSKKKTFPGLLLLYGEGGEVRLDMYVRYQNLLKYRMSLLFLKQRE